MPDFLHNDNLPDLERLRVFIDFIHDDVLSVVRNGKDPKGNPIIDENIRQDFQRGLEQLDKEKRFQNLQASIAKTPVRSLQDHGLLGDLLQFKRKIISWIWAKYQERGGGALFIKLIHVVDTLLDSIINATGVGGAIKEFKDMFAESIESDDTKDRTPPRPESPLEVSIENYKKTRNINMNMRKH